jgi:hypothetical protein
MPDTVVPDTAGSPVEVAMPMLSEQVTSRLASRTGS